MLGLHLAQPDITDSQKALLANRQQARHDKDWQQSDALRDQLQDEGLAVNDTKDGQYWYRTV